MEKLTTIELNNTVSSTYFPCNIELTNPNLEFAHHDEQCDEWIGPVHFDKIEDNTLTFILDKDQFLSLKEFINKITIK